MHSTKISATITFKLSRFHGFTNGDVVCKKNENVGHLGPESSIASKTSEDSSIKSEYL